MLHRIHSCLQSCNQPAWRITAALGLSYALTCTLSAPACVAPAQAQPQRAAEVDAKVAAPQRADKHATKDAALQRAVNELAEWVAEHDGSLSASIVEVESNEVQASHAAGQVLNPASNQKLVTAAAALALLGPEHRFATSLHGDFEAGSTTVRGLVLHGGGDPSLDVGDLAQLAVALGQMGIRSVRGGIGVDQSYFDAQFVPPAFEQQPNEWAAFRAPVSALALESNAVTLNILATQAGKPARVWFDPPGFVEVRGTVETKAVGSGQNAQLTVKPDAGRLVAQVGGHVAEGLPRMRFSRRVDDPTLFPGYVFRELLNRSGIEVQGEVSVKKAQGSPLTFVESPPLSVLLLPVGKESNNFYAETIFKALGHEPESQAPASSKRAAARVQDWLKQQGLLSEKARITNGSGLFDANLLSAELLASLLVAMHRAPEVQPEYVTQLAIGGVDGTLKSRFRSFSDSYAIRAKSGTLRDTIALSGYVLRPGGRSPLAFSFLVNGISGRHGQIRSRIDRVVTKMVQQR